MQRGSFPRRALLVTALAAVLAITWPVAARSGTAATSRSPAAGGPAPFLDTQPPGESENPPDRSQSKGSEGEGRAESKERVDPGGPQILVQVPRDLSMTSRPGGGRVVGVLPDDSKYYHVPTVAWIQQISDDERFGRLAVPYSGSGRSGWIRIDRLDQQTTNVTVRISLARHELTVERRGSILFRAPAATGAPSSPTPKGRYFLTDRIPFGPGSYLGDFAFGISGIQPRLPVGWSGGDQLAIHGTNDPSSIGKSASAGCLRVSAGTLDRLLPLLQLGTPVIVRH